MASGLPRFNEMLDALAKCGPDCAFAKLGVAVVFVDKGAFQYLAERLSSTGYRHGGESWNLEGRSRLLGSRFRPMPAMTSHTRGADAYHPDTAVTYSSKRYCSFDKVPFLWLVSSRILT